MKQAKKPSERSVKAAANRAQNRRVATSAVVLARLFHTMGTLVAQAAKLSGQLWQDSPPDDTTAQLLLEQFCDGAKSAGVPIPAEAAAELLQTLRKGAV